MEIVSKYEPDPELVAKRAIGREEFTRSADDDDIGDNDDVDDDRKHGQTHYE